MAQSKKRGTGNRSGEKAPVSKTIDKAPRWSWAGFSITAVVIAIMMAIVGVFYYQERVAPFRQTIISVDGITINMDYFLRRARLAGADPISMLQTLTTEQLIKLGAPRYGIAVTREDIDQTLMTASNTTSDGEFRAWYRQTLNENGLSDSEYREITAISLTSARLQEYLAARVPTVANQIHLHTIILDTLEATEKVRARWADGEDFADLAREVSLDRASAEQGGDLGWFPRGILDFQIEYAAFDLSTDNVSEPLAYYDVSDPSSPDVAYYYLLLVSEKTDSREISEDYLPTLRGQALQNWLTEEYQFHKISSNFNSEINAWLSWQLAKK